MKKFIDIQNKIQAAINRVDARLKSFKERVEKDPQDVEPRWSDWHDLRYRLEDRMHDNYNAYKDWHWETQGFNAYL